MSLSIHVSDALETLGIPIVETYHLQTKASFVGSAVRSYTLSGTGGPFSGSPAVAVFRIIVELQGHDSTSHGSVGAPDALFLHFSNPSSEDSFVVAPAAASVVRTSDLRHKYTIDFGDRNPLMLSGTASSNGNNQGSLFGARTTVSLRTYSGASAGGTEPTITWVQFVATPIRDPASDGVSMDEYNVYINDRRTYKPVFLRYTNGTSHVSSLSKTITLIDSPTFVTTTGLYLGRLMASPVFPTVPNP
jgi:hypothetical protein